MTTHIPLPPHEGCFVCDASAPNGIGVQWYGDSNGQTIFGRLTISEAYEGPPAHVHGGASAAILDDAMGSCAWYAGNQVMTASMTVDYRRPVPLNTPLIATATVTRTEGRKTFVKAQLTLEDDTVLAESTGIFVAIPEGTFLTPHFKRMSALAEKIKAAREAAQ